MEFSLGFWLLLIVLAIAFIATAVLIQRKRKRYPGRPEQLYNFNIPYKHEHIAYSVILLGDMGAMPSGDGYPLATMLKAQMKQCQEDSAVIFLGDNVYPRGLPEEDDATRAQAEARLKAQLDLVQNFCGKVYFLSGNHDWNKGRRGGWEYVIRQQKYVEEYLGRENVFLPHNGCPGPIDISLSDDLHLIIINTQWWVQQGEKPFGKKDGCTVESEEDFFAQLQEVLEKYKHKHLLIAGHHPMFSNSAHGGKFTYKQHLFPLTSLNKKFYIPLPVVGSLYPLYRKVYGAKEDISFPAYKKMRRKLLRVFKHFPGLVYAAGHDHNLQYFRKNKQHYLVSGSGSKLSYTKRGGSAQYAEAKHGFLRINYLKNKEVWLEVWHPKEDGTKAYLAYLSLLEK